MENVFEIFHRAGDKCQAAYASSRLNSEETDDLDIEADFLVM